MVERICAECQFGNPVDTHFCGKCGAPLERMLPMRVGSQPLMIAGRSIPVKWQQVGKTVALGAAALLAEAGLAWLRNRVETGQPIKPGLPAKQHSSDPARSVVTIISQRVIEVVEDQQGHKTISDRQIWRKIDQ